MPVNTFAAVTMLIFYFLFQAFLGALVKKFLCESTRRLYMKIRNFSFSILIILMIIMVVSIW